MPLFGAGSGLFGASSRGGLFGAPQPVAPAPSVSTEQLLALQQLLLEEERRRRGGGGGGGGIGGFIRGAVGAVPGLDHIPYAERAVSQIAEGLILGIPGAIMQAPKYVAGNVSDITSGLGANPATWAEAGGLSLASIGGLLPTAGLYREARGQESQTFGEVIEPMGQAFAEDFRHPLRNIGYLALDLAGIASLGRTTAARAAAGSARARFARGGGPVSGPAGQPVGPPPADFTPPLNETIRLPDLEEVGKLAASVQQADRAAVENAALAERMMQQEAPSAIPSLEQLQQVAEPGPFDLAALEDLARRTDQQVVDVPETVPEQAPVPEPAPIEEAQVRAAAEQAAGRPDLEAVVEDLAQQAPIPEGPQTPLDYAIGLVQSRMRTPQLRAAAQEGPHGTALDLTLNLIENERRRATGEPLLPVRYPDMTDPKLDLGSYLKGKEARLDQLKRQFSSNTARAIARKLDSIGAYLVQERDVAGLRQRPQPETREFVPRPREGTTMADEDYVLHRGGAPTSYGWRLSSYGPGEEPQPRYRITDEGQPVSAEIADKLTANRLARTYAAEAMAGLPPELRELSRGSSQLVRLGEQAAKAEGKQYVSLQEALEIADDYAAGRQRGSRAGESFQMSEMSRTALERSKGRGEKFDALQRDLASRETILGVKTPESQLTPEEHVALKAEAPEEMHPFLDEIEKASDPTERLAGVLQGEPLSPSHPLFEQLRLRGELPGDIRSMVVRLQEKDMPYMERMNLQQGLALKLLKPDEPKGPAPRAGREMEKALLGEQLETPVRATDKPAKSATSRAGLRLSDVREVAPSMGEKQQRDIARQVRNEVSRRREAGEPVTVETVKAAAVSAGLNADQAAQLAKGFERTGAAEIKLQQGSFSKHMEGSGFEAADIAELKTRLSEVWRSAKAEGRSPREPELRKVLDFYDAKYGAGTGDRLFHKLYEIKGSPGQVASAIAGVLASIGTGDVTGASAAGIIGLSRRGPREIIPRSGPPTLGHIAMEYLRGFVGPLPDPGVSQLTRLTEEGRELAAELPRSHNRLTSDVQGWWHRFLQDAADDVRREELGQKPRNGKLLRRQRNYLWEKKVDHYQKTRQRLMAPAVLATKQAMWEAEVERLDAVVDSLQLSEEQKYQLRQEFAEELGDSPAQLAEAAAKKPPETGLLGKSMDSANQLASLLLLYLKPGYVPPNFLGQVLFTTIDHAWNPIALGNSWKIARDLMQHFPEEDMMAQQLAHAGPATVLKQERGFQGPVGSRLQRTQEFMADLWSKMIDDPAIFPFRRLAITHELARRGYRTAEAQAQVLRSVRELGTPEGALDPAVAKRYVDLEQAVLQGNRNIIDYGNLGSREKQVVRRVVLFYPWVKGATQYAGRFLAHHPAQAAVGQQLGKEVKDEIADVIGAVPSYLEGYIPMPGFLDDVPVLSNLVGPSSRNIPGVGEVPRLINPGALTPLGQGGEVLNMARAFLAGDVRQVERPGGLLNPWAAGVLGAATRTDPFFGGAIPEEMGFLEYMGQELPQINLPGQVLSNVIGATTGQSPKELGLPEVLFPETKSQKIETGEIDREETLLPTTPQEEIGRFIVGGIYPGSVNPAVARERAQAEAFSSMSDAEATKIRWRDKLQLATEAVRQIGEKMPSELRQAAMQKARRDINYRTWAERADLSYSDMTTGHKLAADLDLVVQMGKMTPVEARQLLEAYGRSGETGMQNLRRRLADLFFGQSVISAYSSYYKRVFLLQGIDSDFDLDLT